MVTKIAKGSILLNAHMKLTSSWPEDFHKISLVFFFGTIWQCQWLQKILSTNQPTNQPLFH